MRTAFGLVLSVSAAALLGGCAGSGDSFVAQQSPQPKAPAKSLLSATSMDDVTRGILAAAGLDPADPNKPKEIRRQFAGVVQVRFRGKNYGTALARPTPGRLAFVDPAAVADMLTGSPAAKAELVRMLKPGLVDVASRDCQFDGKHDRKVRRAFKLKKTCVSPSGAVWADLNRSSMSAELHMESRMAALIQNSPNTAVAAAVDEEPAAVPVTMASINLFAPNLLAGTPSQVEATLPAAAPMLPTPAVLTMADQPAPAKSPELEAASPWATLMGPGTAIPVQQPIRRAVVLPMPEPAPEPAPLRAPIALSAPVRLPDPVRQMDPVRLPEPATASAPVVLTAPVRLPDQYAAPAEVRPVQAAPVLVAAPSSAVVANGDALRPVVLTSDEPYERVRQDSGSFGYADRSEPAAADGRIKIISGAYQPGPPTTRFLGGY